MKLNLIDRATGEYLRTIESDIMIPLSTPKPLPEHELNENEFFSLRDKNDQVPYHTDDNCDWIVKTRLIAVTAYNKITLEQKEFDDESLVDDDYTLKAPPSKYHTFDSDWMLTDENAQQQLNDARKISTQQIDNLAADIYAQVNKFMIEYTPAEEEALAFKANNYEGEAGTYIMSDAIPNNITPQKACDNIIAKSQAWRSLLKPMRTLRMRKAELQRCTSIEEINAITDDIIKQLNTIKALL